jgi:hypothetical protein
MSNNDTELQYCNWTFWECLKPGRQWSVGRDCQGGREEDVMITLTRGDSRNWKAYYASLQSQIQTRFPRPLPGAQCPNCGKQVNGVNPYDDGETWRR